MVEQIGYVQIETADTRPWLALGEAIGFELATAPDRGVGLRMDADRWARILLRPGTQERLELIGWEAADAAAYRASLRLLAEHGAMPEERPDLAALRNVKEVATFRDPDGLGGELYWGARTSLRLPFRSPEHVRFVAGAAGMGHVTLSVRDIDATVDFYCATLGLKLTEVADVGQLGVTFLRAGRRHHTLALAELPSRIARVDHVMVEVETLDDLGSIRDRLAERGQVIERDLGRHPTDGVVSLYVQTPAPFTLEIGWGSILIDEATWPRERYARSGWSWGHHSPAAPGVALGAVAEA